MIIQTDQAEQSRNIRWAFLHRACNLASMISSITAMAHILDPEIEESILGEVETLKDRWCGEVMYASSRGLIPHQSHLRRSHV